jgi:hypothetical protein
MPFLVDEALHLDVVLSSKFDDVEFGLEMGRWKLKPDPFGRNFEEKRDLISFG